MHDEVGPDFSSHHMSTRRQFLRDCSAVVAGLAVVPLMPLTAAAAGEKPAPNPMSYAALSAQVTTLFRVRLDAGKQVTLKLLKARQAPVRPTRAGSRSPADAGNEKFSLIFSGPKDELLPEAIHHLEHDVLGKLDIYLGRIGTPDEHSVRYEAVFNLAPPRGATHKD